MLLKSRFIELFKSCNNIKTLKDCNNIFVSDGNYSAKYPRNDEFVHSGIPFIRANNLKNGTVDDEDLYFITEEKHSILKKGHLKYKDVLITTRGNIGQTAVVPEKHENSNINAQIVLLRITDCNLLPEYLADTLESDFSHNQIQTLITGTALKQLPVGQLKKIKIMIPEIALQKQYVDELKQIDKSKFLLQQMIEKLELLKKSRFIELYGDPRTNSKNLKTKKFIDIVNLKRGFDLPTQNRKEDGNIPVIGSNGIVGFHNEKKINRDGVLVGRSGSVGEVIYSKESYWPLNTSLYSDDLHGNNAKFLYFLLKFFDLKRFANGTGVPTLNRNNFLNESLIYIDRESQDDFVKFVELIDKSKLVLEKMLEDLVGKA